METKEKIFNCAVKLFSEKGFDGVSIRDIAKAVGIKESSIYNHFDGKNLLLMRSVSGFQIHYRFLDRRYQK